MLASALDAKLILDMTAYIEIFTSLIGYFKLVFQIIYFQRLHIVA